VVTVMVSGSVVSFLGGVALLDLHRERRHRQAPAPKPPQAHIHAAIARLWCQAQRPVVRCCTTSKGPNVSVTSVVLGAPLAAL